MEFGLIDIVLIAFVALFVISGLYYGFIHTFGNLLGMTVGILAGGYAIVWLDGWLQILSQPIGAIIVFLLIILFISRIIGWLVDLIDEMYKILTIIPFLTSINKLLGAVFGFIEGMLTVASLIYFTTSYLPGSAITASILTAPTTQWLGFTINIVKMLFPKIVSIV